MFWIFDRDSPDDAVYLNAFLKKEFGQIGAILTRDSTDQHLPLHAVFVLQIVIILGCRLVFQGILGESQLLHINSSSFLTSGTELPGTDSLIPSSNCQWERLELGVSFEFPVRNFQSGIFLCMRVGVDHGVHDGVNQGWGRRRVEGESQFGFPIGFGCGQ